MSQPTGFTLVLDGKPEEVARILRAASAEFALIERETEVEARRLYVLGGDLRPLTPRYGSLRGRIDLRHDLDGWLP